MNNRTFFKNFVSPTQKGRREILARASEDELKAIAELCFNLKVIQLSNAQVKNFLEQNLF